MDILNYYPVSGNLATSGQPNRGQFKEIADAGYEIVINLGMPDHKDSICDEGGIISSLGMTYIHIPVPFDAPTESQFKEFSNYVSSLEDRKVWVHCIVNARVSAFIFRHFRDVKNVPADEIQNPVLQAWLPNMDDVWKNFIA
jgi:protein tyrosine phosphatase (PTP) superfamily phosphohydrolase (DUF442 family)